MTRLRDNFVARRYQWIKRTFRFWERHGAHVVPVHFYEPIPDTRLLDPSLWESSREMVGVDLRVENQLALLRRFADRYRDEYERFPIESTGRPHEYFESNGLFASTDAEILHCMIRDHRPRRVVEVGSGFSSLITAQALLRNASEARPRAS
jgi:hypothetical protein